MRGADIRIKSAWGQFAALKLKFGCVPLHKGLIRPSLYEGLNLAHGFFPVFRLRDHGRRREIQFFDFF